MKILYLTDQIFLHGGVEKVLSQKSNYLADICGDEVFIVTYNQENKIPVYRFSHKITFIDLNINYDISISYFAPENLKKIPTHISALKNILKKIKPDVVVSSSFGPDFYFIPFIQKQIPKVKEFHGSRFFYESKSSSQKGQLLNKLNSFVEKKYSAISVLNSDEVNFYNNKNIVVIPNPSEKTDYRADLSSKKIMAAGRISPVKNFGDLIDCFSRLAGEFPDWELHFWGDNYVATREKLEKRVAEKGLKKQIVFKGLSSDLKKEMRNYSIYAMTSKTECFPMVLLEALSVGMPVISYDSPTGPSHIIKNEEDSFLIPYKNLDIFTQKLRKLMQDENVRCEFGNNGKNNVERFAIANVMSRWQNLFTSMIQ